MKKLASILIAGLCFTLLTCKKENHVSDNTLTGKWKLAESLNDPGNGSGKWIPVSAELSQQYVQFDSDGKLEGTAFSDYVSYVVKDSITLAFTSKDKVLQNFHYSIKNGIMEMSPAGPIQCIEACATRYAKVKR